MKLITHLKYTYFSALAFLLGAPSALAWNTASAAGGGGVCTTTTGLKNPNFKCLVGFATDMINQLVIILIGIGLLVFIFGLVKYVAAAGDEAKIKEAKQFIVFGLIAFFVMMSVWGLVNILVYFFFPQGTGLFVPQLK